MKTLDRFIRFLGVISLALASPVLYAQTYPNRPITMVVGFPPGGATDSLARAVAEKLASRLGQPIVVDNRPGANTVIATNHVRQTQPDGYTIYMATPAFGQAPVVTPGVAKYDALKDFTLIAQTAGLLNVMVVNPEMPVRTVKELIDYAKSNPGKLSFATTGIGSTDHLGGELFAYRNGLKLNFIPYRGGAPATQDLLSGVVNIRIDAMAGSRQFIDSGKLRALAVMEPKRHPGFPSIPAISETGSGMEYGGYFGIVGPKGIPPAIVNRLSSEINMVMKTQEVIAKINQMGLDVITGTPEEFVRVVEKDSKLWAQLLADTGLKIE